MGIQLGFEKSKRELGSGPTRLPPAGARRIYGIRWVYWPSLERPTGTKRVYRGVYRDQGLMEI